MKHMTLFLFAILCSCAENEGYKDSLRQSQSSAKPIVTNVSMINDSISYKEANPIIIDTNLIQLAQHMKTERRTFIGLKPLYQFVKDTILVVDSIPVYNHDLSDILNYYHQ